MRFRSVSLRRLISCASSVSSSTCSHASAKQCPAADASPSVAGILEGITAIERDAYAAMAQRGGSRLRSVLTAGGGAKNEAWTAMRQRALGVPVSMSPQGLLRVPMAFLACPPLVLILRLFCLLTDPGPKQSRADRTAAAYRLAARALQCCNLAAIRTARSARACR